MPMPEFVNHGGFTVQKIVFDDGAFSVAWGVNNDGQKQLGMRWNGGDGGDGGDDSDFGFPTYFLKKPLWLFLPKELTIPILRGLLGHGRSDGFAIAEIIQVVMAQAPAHANNL